MVEVSVVIPTYNRGWCLSNAVDSLLNQSFQNFDIVIVDDGSTDNTSDLVRTFSKKIHRADRLQYFYQENKGPSAARNLGISKARGEYIAFLDSDDLWKKDKLAKQVAFAKNNPCYLISYTDEIWIRNKVRVNPKKKHSKFSGWIFLKCLPLCIISPSSVFMHRSVFETVGCFDESLIVCEDYDMWLRLSNLFYIHFIQERLIIKNGGHKDQISRKYWGSDILRVKALIKIIESALTLDFNRRAAIMEFKGKCMILHSGFLKREKSKESYFFESLYHSYDHLL